MNQKKLQNLVKVLTPDDTRIDFSNFDNEVKKLQVSLKEKIQAKTLDDVNSALEQNRKKINFQPLLTAFETLKKNLTDQNNQVNQTLLSALDGKIVELNQKLSLQETNLNVHLADEGLKNEIDQLNAEIAVLQTRKVEIPDFGSQIKEAEIKLNLVIQSFQTTNDQYNKTEAVKLQTQFIELDKEIKDLRLKLQQRGGGSMSRQIFIGGADPLTRYTDINLKAGSNVTITYANNNTTKKVDITIASTGGGGGSVRSINSVSTPTTAGSTSGTDYVYLVSGTTTITLPTAVGNTNLYTIKNVGTGVVTINTTSSQTIDGSLTVSMPVQYTAVDLISDTANWNVT